MACPIARGRLNYALAGDAGADGCLRMLRADAQHIERRLIELNVEHRDLDAVIELLILDGHHDELQLRRLKKRKLQLKDHITLLKMQLVPDVPA
eukprot:gene23610-28288_t